VSAFCYIVFVYICIQHELQILVTGTDRMKPLKCYCHGWRY